MFERTYSYFRKQENEEILTRVKRATSIGRATAHRADAEARNDRLILGKLNSRCNARFVIRTIDWWHQNISVRLTGGGLSLTSGPSFSGIVIDFNIGAAPLTPFNAFDR